MLSITVFAVAPEADGPFVAGWQRARDGQDATLLRALREDADFRFAELSPGELSDLSGADPRIVAHTGRYEAVHEDGDVDGAGGAILVNPFEVAPEDDEAFLAAWRAARDALAGHRGYLGTRLHRGAGPAKLRWVNVARWSSPLMLARALREDPPRVPFPAHPALYQPVAR
jgi:hypothetical protein